MANVELLQGTLDALILQVLSEGAMHGYAITRRLEELSRSRLQVQEGSLYPALYRMERRGWITSSPGLSENNRRARFYKLTSVGKRQLNLERQSWADFSQVVSKILES